MVKNGERIGIAQVYQLVNETRKELSNDINRLEKKFDDLEVGRLSALEKDFANLQGKMAVVAGVISIGVSILFLILNIFLRK